MNLDNAATAAAFETRYIGVDESTPRPTEITPGRSGRGQAGSGPARRCGPGNGVERCPQLREMSVMRIEIWMIRRSSSRPAINPEFALSVPVLHISRQGIDLTAIIFFAAREVPRTPPWDRCGRRLKRFPARQARSESAPAKHPRSFVECRTARVPSPEIS